MLIQKIGNLKLIISKLQAQNILSARDDLRKLAEGKAKAKINDKAEKFRAINLDIREGRLELTVESLEEFIKASRDRMKVSPFDKELNIWELSDSRSEHSDALSDDSKSASKTESGGKHDTDWNSSDGGERPRNTDYGDDEDREEDGWETADKG